MRRLQIDHTTTYQYPATVNLLPHTLLLRPREGHDIRIESSQLEITPQATIKWQRDVYDNSVATATFKKPVQTLSIYSEVVIQHFVDNPFDFLVAQYAVNFPFHYNPSERVDLIPYQISLYPEDTQEVQKWLFQFTEQHIQIIFLQISHGCPCFTNPRKNNFVCITDFIGIIADTWLNTKTQQGGFN